MRNLCSSFVVGMIVANDIGETEAYIFRLLSECLPQRANTFVVCCCGFDDSQCFITIVSPLDSLSISASKIRNLLLNE
jgi:hypothetical protein